MHKRHLSITNYLKIITSCLNNTSNNFEVTGLEKIVNISIIYLIFIYISNMKCQLLFDNYSAY